jgi:hypothetical protein
MFWNNFFIMSFILSPVFILFGMIIFSGKPKDQLKQDEAKSAKIESEK